MQVDNSHSYSLKNSFLAVGAIIIPLIAALYIDSPFSLPAALFASIVFLWLSETIPLPITALLVPALATIYGLASPKEAFAPFGNQVLFLFIGAFLLAEAMRKHCWDKRMAYIVLTQSFVSSPSRLISVVAIICWTLSMWISNTATCAIMMPICIGIIASLGETLSKENLRNFSTRILLVCAFASSIGGMATPVGSPPNVLAIEFLREKGVHLGFLEWLSFGLPVSITMLILLILLLAYKYPVKNVDLAEVKEFFVKQLLALGKIKPQEVQILFCFLLAVILWLLPGIVACILPEGSLSKELENRLPMGSAALIAIAPLFIFRFSINGKTENNLSWADAKNIDWGTIILFGGGLCLGSTLESSGLAAEIGKLIFQFPSQNKIIFGVITILLAILMSEFSSNTASASIVIPIALSMQGIFDSLPIVPIAISAAFGASFGFMLPVSTPPNAIVFGTGKVPLREMIRTGMIFDLLGLIIISLFMLVIYPLLS